MDNDSPLKAIIVVTATALVCSVLVTVAAVMLQPIQQAYQNLERIRFIVEVSGVATALEGMSDLEIIAAFQNLDARVVDLQLGTFDATYNPRALDAVVNEDQQITVSIPEDQDLARLGHRPQLLTVYQLEDGDELQRIILPVYGQGMWSTIYGFVALESDLNTIAAMTIYDQAETAGIGDVILRPDWQATWKGRKIYDEQGSLRFRIARGAVDSDSPEAAYRVDGFTGATVTMDAMTNLIRYWFGPHGYAKFLNNLSLTGGI